MADDEVCALAVRNGVGWVTIANPPTNLVDGAFFQALVPVLDRAESDEAIRVLVFESADPDFFLMHGDVTGILCMPGWAEPLGVANPAQLVHDRLRRFPKPTIGMIDGAARGGGSELLCALDMRFAGPRTVLGQPEVPMGILPGAGGTQLLPRLVGRARALEIILGGADVTADEAAAMGYVNRVLPSDELRPFVTRLAERIAAWPPEAVQRAKRSVDAGLAAAEPQYAQENDALGALVHAGHHRGPMQRFLDAGGQTRDGETQRMAEILDAMR
jgi:enoyl-CoA hydratase/carnithine racemase